MSNPYGETPESKHDYSWVEQVKKEAAHELAGMGKTINERQGNEAQNGLSFGAAKFAELRFPEFHGDITVKDGDVYFHFFPPLVKRQGELVQVQKFVAGFLSSIGDAFNAVFPFPESLCWDSIEDFCDTGVQSLVVKVMGYGDNPNLESFVRQVVNELNTKLGYATEG